MMTIAKMLPARLGSKQQVIGFNLARGLSSVGGSGSQTIKAEHVGGDQSQEQQAQQEQQQQQQQQQRSGGRRRGMRGVTPVGASAAAPLSPAQGALRRMGQPARNLQDFRRGFDDLFRTFEQDLFPSPFTSVGLLGSPFSAFTPATALSSIPMETPLPAMNMDVRVTDASYDIKVELPGLDKEDLKIEVDDARNAITLTAKHEEKLEQGDDTPTDEEEEEQSGWLLRERSYGRVTRSVFLPEDADTSRIQEAELKNGVLRIVVPKKEETAATRSIDIKS